MTIGWGLIGCGDISRKRVAPALANSFGSELVAVSRARPELAESFAKEFGAKRWYSNWKEMLDDDGIDAVYVATPVNLHAEQTIAAANRGKHVLCEKPMALDVAECDAMINACQKAGVALGIAYYRRFYPVITRIKEIIDSGEIGKPVLTEIQAFERSNPEPHEGRYWRMQPDKAGGGPMMDFGCHRIEILLNLFGMPRTVAGSLGNAVYEREVEDTGVAILGYDTGMQAIVSVSHGAFEPRDTIQVSGSLGSISVPVLNRGTLQVRTETDDRIENLPPHPNLHLPLIEEFVQAVGAGRPPGVDGGTGRDVAIVNAQVYREQVL